MGFFNSYPYTNFHELNADWILEKINEFDGRIENLQETITSDVKAYVDSQLQATIDEIKAEFTSFKTSVNSSLAAMTQDQESFKTQIELRMKTVETKFKILENTVNAVLDQANAYTNQAIIANNEYIIEETSKALGAATVLNYFTGARVTIQEMFDYLAQFHLTNAINYSTLIDKNKSYDELAALNISYTQLAIDGGNLIN